MSSEEESFTIGLAYQQKWYQPLLANQSSYHTDRTDQTDSETVAMSERELLAIYWIPDVFVSNAIYPIPDLHEA